jgi:hypothetical protein
MNRFVPFLVVDPHPDLNPGSRDAEEASMEVRGFGVLGFPRVFRAIVWV